VPDRHIREFIPADCSDEQLQLVFETGDGMTVAVVDDHNYRVMS
jgi:hypothetical protein